MIHTNIFEKAGRERGLLEPVNTSLELISFVVSAVTSYLAGVDETIAKDERALAAEKKNVQFGRKNTAND